MLEFFATTTQFAVFVAITLAGVILLLAGAVFGDHDHDHDAGHDHDHEGGHGDPTVSIFSTKVIGTFIMGFGGAGSLATNYGVGSLGASLIGVATGVGLGLGMYGFMRLLYGQQSTSIVRTEETLGRSGIVTTGIGVDSVGEVEVSMGDIRRIYMAQTNSGVTLPKGTQVKVVANSGSRLIVEREGQRVQQQAS